MHREVENKNAKKNKRIMIDRVGEKNKKSAMSVGKPFWLTFRK